MARKKYLGFAGLLVAGIIAGFAAPVAAHIQDDDYQGSAPAAQQAPLLRPQGKLDEAKRNICVSRIENIKKIMTKAGESAHKHLALLNGIHARISEFYTVKQLHIVQYEPLQTAAKTTGDAAAAALKTVKDSSPPDCSGDNPIGDADVFKADVKALHDALKEHRASVNALLVAVKNAAKITGGTP